MNGDGVTISSTFRMLCPYNKVIAQYARHDELTHETEVHFVCLGSRGLEELIRQEHNGEALIAAIYVGDRKITNFAAIQQYCEHMRMEGM